MENFESTVVRLKRSYENTGSVVCLTTKGRQLEQNFEELKPASYVPILGTILNIFDVFVRESIVFITTIKTILIFLLPGKKRYNILTIIQAIPFKHRLILNIYF
jgi:hypothetical protein